MPRNSSQGRLQDAFWSEKVVLIMVGLPARGKSYISSKIVRFINWQGLEGKLFNVGKHRRELVEDSSCSSFFDAEDKTSSKLRDQVAMQVLDELLDWIKEERSDVAIFDATNSTKARRSSILKKCYSTHSRVNVIFLESVCTDQKVIEANMIQKVKYSPDFANMDRESALNDLRKRLQHYEDSYQPIDDDQLSYIKLINLQTKIVCNRIRGSLAHRITSYLMSSTVSSRPVYLCRAGQVDELTKVLGGNHISSAEIHFEDHETNLLPMNSKGIEYSIALSRKIKSDLSSAEKRDPSALVVYHSLSRRASETANAFKFISRKPRPASALNILNTGVCHGVDADVVKKTYPEQYIHWKKGKFEYRFPGGESQEDLVHRLVPIVKEIERHTSPVLIVSHLSTLQVLYGYFVNCDTEQLYHLTIPKDCIIKLKPSRYGWQESRFSMERYGGAIRWKEEEVHSKGLGFY